MYKISKTERTQDSLTQIELNIKQPIGVSSATSSSSDGSIRCKTIAGYIKGLIEQLPKGQAFELKIVLDNTEQKIELDHQDLANLKKLLDENYRLERFSLEQAGQAELDQEQKKLQEIGVAIAARNRLLREYGIDTSGKHFEPWSGLMYAHLLYNSSTVYFEIDSTSYFGKTSGRGLISALDEKYFQPLIELGQIGFKHYLKYIFNLMKSREKSPTQFSGRKYYKNKFVYVPCRETNAEIKALSLGQILETIHELQQETGLAFPFPDLSLVLVNESELTKEKIDNIIRFVKKNPHITFFEIKGFPRLSIGSEAFNYFIEQINKEKIATRIRLDCCLGKYIGYDIEIKDCETSGEFPGILQICKKQFKQTPKRYFLVYVKDIKQWNLVAKTNNGKLTRQVVDATSNISELNREIYFDKTSEALRDFLKTDRNRVNLESLLGESLGCLKADELMQNLSLQYTQLQNAKKPIIKEDEQAELVALPTLAYDPQWDHPRSSQQETKATTQYEHNISQAATVTNESNQFLSLTQSRMQQIEQQQARQQELASHALEQQPSGAILKEISQAYTETNFAKEFNQTDLPYGIEVSNFARHKPKFIRDVYGQQHKFIYKITKRAFARYLSYTEAFANGLVFDNLPRGFAVYQDPDSKERTLYYDEIYVQPERETPLTAKLICKRNEFINEGTVEQFLPENNSLDEGEKQKIKQAFKHIVQGAYSINHREKGFSPQTRITLDAFLLLLKQQDPAQAAKICGKFDRQGGVLQKLSAANYFAMRSILFSQGPTGFYNFINRLQLMLDRGIFASFKACFIDGCNNIESLTQETAINAMDFILRFNKNQAQWWNHLVANQAKQTNKSHFTEMVEAFHYFCEELKKIDPSIQLPLPCELEEVHNMHVSLDRLLWILKNSADPKEQLYNMNGVSLAREAAFYAVRYDGFQFVCAEMELKPEHAETNEPFSYKVNADLLVEYAKGNDADKFKRSFFRYLGTQRYLLPFHYYREIYTKIQAQPALTQTQKQQLLSILAVSTTGLRAFKVDPEKYIQQLIDGINEFDGVEENINNYLSYLQAFCQKDRKPTLLQLVAVSRYYLRLKMMPEEIEALNKGILRYLDEAGQDGISAIEALGLRGARISWQEFLKIIDEVDSDYYQLIPVIARLQKLENISNLFAKLPEEHAQLLVKALCQINVNGSLLTWDNISKIIKDLKSSSGSLNSENYRQLIRTHVKDVKFNVPDYDEVKVDCRNEVIALLESLRSSSMLSGIIGKIVPEGHDINSMIEQLKAANATVTIDSLVENFVSQSREFPPLLIALIGPRLVSVCSKQTVGMLADLAITEPAKQAMNGVIEHYLNNHHKLKKTVSDPKGKSTKPTEELQQLQQFIQRRHTLKNLLQAFKNNQGQGLSKFIEIIADGFLDKNYDEQTELLSSAKNLISDNRFNLKDKANLLLLVKKNNLYQVEEKLLNNMAALKQNNLTLFAIIIDKINQSDDVNAKTIRTVFEQLSNLQEKLDNTEKLSILAKELDFDGFQELILWFIPLKSEKLKPIVTIVTSLVADKIETNVAELGLHLFRLNFLSNPTDRLERIAQLYQHRPYPNKAKLQELLNEKKDIDEIIKHFHTYPFGEDDQTFKDVYEEGERETLQLRLQQIYEPVSQGYLDGEAAEELSTQVANIYNYGKDIKALSDVQIREGVALCRKILQDEEVDLNAIGENNPAHYVAQQLDQITDPAQCKQAARILALAYLRVVIYRTSKQSNKIDVRDTQLASVLFTLNHGGNLVAGIDTGQGKSFVCALQAALLWCEGHTVDVCSAAGDLAQRDLNSFADFYNYIGAKATKITEASPLKDYHNGEIHYASVPGLALFRARKRIESPEIGTSSTPLSLILDEADAALLDNTSLFILSRSHDNNLDPDKNRDAWIYPLVNVFVDYLAKDQIAAEYQQELDEFFQGIEKPTIVQEIKALLRFLNNHASLAKEKQRLAEHGIAEQLNQWIKSAKVAKSLQENKNYIVANDDDGVKRAVVLDETNKRPRPEARWSYGVHQLLHARKNSSQSAGEDSTYAMEPERVAIMSDNSATFLNPYLNTRGRILGATGTPGSFKECAELRAKFAMDVYKIPPHKPRQRQDLDDEYITNIDELAEKLAKQIGQLSGEPVLIICQDIKDAEALKAALKQQSLYHWWYQDMGYEQKKNSIQLLTALNIGDRETIDGEAGKDHQITISTVSGRGTDIRMQGEKGQAKGLWVASIGLVNKRGEDQRKGRTARNGKPGNAKRYVLTEPVKQKYSVDLVSQKDQAKARSVQTIQQALDDHSAKAREQNQRREDILHYVQEEFLLWYSKFSADENERLAVKADDILKLQAKALAEFSKKWADINSSNVDFVDQVTDQNNPLEPAQRLNRRTNEFIEFVSRGMNRYRMQLRILAGTETLPQELNAPFKLREKIGSRKIKVKKPTKVDRNDGWIDGYKLLTGTLSRERTTFLRYYSQELGRSAADKKSLRQLRKYQEDNKQQATNKAFELAKQLIKAYKRHSWLKWVANDRVHAASRLLKLLGDLENQENTKNVANLIGSINISMIATINNDVRTEQRFLKRTRKVLSRYRDLLQDLKSVSLSLCPHDKLVEVVTNELKYAKVFAQAEIKRRIFTETNGLTEIGGLLDELITKLSDTNTDDKTKLNQAMYYLDKIVHHPDYDKERTSITYLRKNLKYLHFLAMRAGKAQYKQAALYDRLRKMAKSIQVPAAPKSYVFWPDYSLPNKHLYSNVFTDVPADQKFALYHVTSQIRNSLATIGGFNFRFSYDNEKRQLTVDFDILHARKLSNAHHKFMFDIDNNYGVTVQIPEPSRAPQATR